MATYMIRLSPIMTCIEYTSISETIPHKNSSTSARSLTEICTYRLNEQKSVKSRYGKMMEHL